MGKIYTFNDKIITINNKWCEEYVEPTPLYPIMNTLQSGYRPSDYYTTFYWWVPRTNRMLNGERPFFCYARWGGYSTTRNSNNCC